MADTTSVRGVKIKLEGDASGLIKEFKNIRAEVNQTQKYLNDINKLLKLDPENLQGMTQKMKYLQESIEENEKKLKSLKDISAELSKLEPSKAATDAQNAVQREIEATRAAIANANQELKTTQERMREVASEAKEPKKVFEEVWATAKKLAEETEKVKFDKNLFTSMGDGLEKFGRKIETFAQKIQPFTSALSVMTTFSARSFADFESAFAGVRKTVDASEEEFETLQGEIRDMAQTTASSAEEIAGVMEVAGQLGVATEDLATFTKTMVMLGDSTNLAANEGAVNLAKFLNITNTSADQIDRIGASIVDLGNNFATQEQDIVDMSYYLASAGSAAGLSAQEILGLATAMSSAGIKAAAGGSSMMKTLRSLDLGVKELPAWQGQVAHIGEVYGIAGDRSDELYDISMKLVDGEYLEQEAIDKLVNSFGLEEKAAKGAVKELKGMSKEARLVKNTTEKLGMSAEEFGELWKNEPIEALKEFIKMLGNAYDEGDSLYVVMDELGVSEIRQSNMLRALSISYENFDSAIATANKAYDENTALVTEANKRYKTYDSKLNQAKEKMKELGASIGERLIPHLLKLFEKADDLLKIWDNLNSEQKDSIALFAAIGGKFTIFAKVVGTISDGFGKFSLGIGHVITDLHKLSGISDGAVKPLTMFGSALAKLGVTTPMVGVAAAGLTALGAAIGAVAIVTKTWSGDALFKEKIEEITSTFPDIQEYTKGLDNMREALVKMNDESFGEATTIDVQFSGLDDAWTKLHNITDENGKIKEGFELQAEAIVGKLNSALGLSLEIIDGEIQGYADVAKNIDLIIEKKKAELYLNAYADDYEQALKGQAEAQKQLLAVKNEESEINEKLIDAQNRYNEIVNSGEPLGSARVAPHLEEIAGEIEAYETRLKDLGETQKTISNDYTIFANTITNYSALSAAAVGDGEKSISDAMLKLKYSFTDATNATKEQLEEQAQYYYEKYKEMKRAVEDGTAGATKAQVDELRTMANLSRIELANVAKEYDDAAKNAAEGFGATISTTLDAEAPKIKGAIENATKFDAVGLAQESGAGLVNTLADTIARETERRKEAFLTPAKMLRNNLHFSVPDEGPLRTADEWGPDFMKLYAEGIKSNTWRVEKAIVALNDDIATTMGGSTQYGIVANGGNPNSVVNQYSNTMGGVNFVINAAEGQDVYAIANAVNEILAHQYEQQERAFRR